MAEAPELSKAALILKNTRLIVDDLPRVAEDWGGWPEDVQANFTLEWMALMTNLTYVADRVRLGEATGDEQAEYRRLQADFRAAAPILSTLELHVPAELLRPVAPSVEVRSAS